MATRAQIVRLTQRIDTIAARKVKSWPGKVVFIKVDGESNGALRGSDTIVSILRTAAQTLRFFS